MNVTPRERVEDREAVDPISKIAEDMRVAKQIDTTRDGSATPLSSTPKRARIPSGNSGTQLLELAAKSFGTTTPCRSKDGNPFFFFLEESKVRAENGMGTSCFHDLTNVGIYSLSLSHVSFSVYQTWP
ncbi:hypothetical protein Tco_0442285 [Tanacetum coccineum]